MGPSVSVNGFFLDNSGCTIRRRRRPPFLFHLSRAVACSPVKAAFSRKQR